MIFFFNTKQATALVRKLLIFIQKNVTKLGHFLKHVLPEIMAVIQQT